MGGDRNRMSDTLVIGGTTYTGVTGFKATDNNDATKTYIRPDGSLSITTNDTYDVTQYASAVVNVSGGSPNLQSKTGITPGASSVTVTPDTGYDGLSSVQIDGDADLVAANIKKDVSIFGVTGTYEGGGGGGGVQYKKGTYTPSSTYSTAGNREITTLANIGFTPKKFVFYVTNRSNLSGQSAVLLYAMCDTERIVRFNIRYSNTSGTTGAGGVITNWGVQANNHLYCDGTTVYYRTSTTYILVSNVEYTWEAFG